MVFGADALSNFLLYPMRCYLNDFGGYMHSRAKLLLFLVLILVYVNACKRTIRDENIANHIRGDLGFLANDALHGRGSGTRDELIAAVYIASQLSQAGLKPGGDNGGFMQNVSTDIRLDHQMKPWNTRNVIAVLPGSDRTAKKEIIMLSAHMDHLGIGKPVNGDEIYNGADDDASGCAAVLELARVLAQSGPVKRTVIFVFFGSEETGGQGVNYFLQYPPVPLENIAANLEFEMIGRADPMIQPNKLWFTGYERSDLGPELTKHGFNLVADPRPREHFFERSDNFPLAQHGIVAHAISSFGLHKDYHKPSDDLAGIDFNHMEQAISSAIEPIEWLVNSGYRPQWVGGNKPEQ